MHTGDNPFKLSVIGWRDPSVSIKVERVKRKRGTWKKSSEVWKRKPGEGGLGCNVNRMRKKVWLRWKLKNRMVEWTMKGRFRGRKRRRMLKRR